MRRSKKVKVSVDTLELIASILKSAVDAQINGEQLAGMNPLVVITNQAIALRQLAGRVE